MSRREFAIWFYSLFGIHKHKFVSDRNEPGPMGNGGQWWYDVFKCKCGEERKMLVASPRG